ncbi:MAG: hypothetical protein AB1578_17620 [Thermodesulfobacteriota bacterium]
MLERLRLFLVLAAAALVLGLGPAAHAQTVCPPDGPPPPLLTGPENPDNGFPLWFQDETGLTLQVCLNPDLCFFDPVDPTNPYSVQVGFGPEAFWWLAEGTIEAANIDVLVTMAAEAAWAAEVPNPGDQFPFTRLRIRIDIPVAGTYTLTHPYGVEVFEVDVPGTRAVNESFDIPVPAPFFGRTHTSRVGNFLVWDTNFATPPAGYVGDGATPARVTGSPCGTNFLQITAVDTNGQPIDLDGQGNNTLFTDLFIVQGQLFQGTPTVVDRTTYARSASGQVDVWARSVPGAAVTVSGGPNLPAGEIPLLGDLAGNYFGHIQIPNAATLPLTVNVTADNSANNPDQVPSTLVRELVDEVAITEARYDPFAQTLTITAASSDAFAPPVLTAEGLGDLVGGTLVVNDVQIPPVSVTVTSSAGGSDTEPVSVFAPPVESVTLAAAPASPQAAGAQVIFTATAAGGSGNYQYRFWLRTGGVWAVVQPYGASNTWTWNTTGVDNATFFVQVDARNAGSTVNRDVAAVASYVINNDPPITAVDLAADPASPQESGPAVTFTATPTGGGANIEYRFWLRTGTTWAVVQPYGAGNTWQWPTAGLPVGTYYVQVDARNVGSPNARDAAKVLRYDLVAPPPAPATGVTLFSDLESPQTAGTLVNFAAQGQGGTGDYQYRFWLKTGPTWATVQPYSADATWDWNTTGAAPGTYFVQVDVRSTGSTVNRDAAQVVSYEIVVIE